MTPKRRSALTVVAAVWFVLAVAGDILLNLLPIPPGSATDIAASETQTIRLLTLFAWPIFIAVLAGLVVTLYVNRIAPHTVEPDAQSLRGNRRLQTIWIGSTIAIVLFLAVFGTVTLANDVTIPTTPDKQGNQPLEVQVIAQQWYFTYRYPSFGGFESDHLVLPAGREIDFHVTSLDVVHSFWFYAAGIKADAVPLNDNEVDMVPMQVGTYRIECSELCGIWHGSMSDDHAQIVSTSDFMAWAQQEQQLDQPIMKYLPQYSHTYVPNPGAYGS